MPTYKETFYLKFANARGNVRKNVKIDDIWNSIEEFLRLVLDPPKKNGTKNKKATSTK